MKKPFSSTLRAYMHKFSQKLFQTTVEIYANQRFLV